MNRGVLGIATLLAGLMCVTASLAHAQQAQPREMWVGGSPPSNEGSDRVIVGVEGAVMFPFTDPLLAEYYPGGTISLATQFSVTKFLMPLLRVRGGALSAQQNEAAYLLTASAGLRFRPRGIAHPEEPSRASCVWAEIDASIAALNGEVHPAYEIAIGFDFIVDDIDFGPVVRFVHVIGEQAPYEQTYLLTGGLEILFNDAR
ncbi:MAG: hypothetical protein H6719_25305 [Sandaracinaceae bacterium]|nr:hypothetical protein [Sandaracinaceae bacterium]